MLCELHVERRIHIYLTATQKLVLIPTLLNGSYSEVSFSINIFILVCKKNIEKRSVKY